MATAWFILLALFLALFLLVAVLRYLLPLHKLSKVIERLADGDYSPVMFLGGSRPLRRIASQINTIRERLIEQRRQLRDEGFSLQAILSSMAEGVLIADAQRRVRLVNSALVEMFQIKTSPINKSVMEVFHSVPLNNALKQALETGLPQSVSFSLRQQASPAGVIQGHDTKHFEVNAVALDAASSDGEHLGLVAVFHDISELRQQQVARQELMANVSHELRTPLSIISGYIETLLDDGFDDPQMARHFLSTMQKHSERLSFLIEDMMTVSRLESQSPGLVKQELYLSDCVQHVLERIDSTIKSANAEVRLLKTNNERPVMVDADRMDQVFFNLLDNALKYCIGKRPVIEIRIECQPARVKVTVSDNGPGIPIEHRPHIFERFYRVERDRARDSGGTGLGLAIVKHVVLAHGGNVSIGDSPLGGAQFTILLPMHTNDESTPRLDMLNRLLSPTSSP